MHKKDLEESARETSRENKGGTPCEMLLDTRKEKSLKEATVRIACQREFHRGQGRVAKRAAEAL